MRVVGGWWGSLGAHGEGEGFVSAQDVGGRLEHHLVARQHELLHLEGHTLLLAPGRLHEQRVQSLTKMVGLATSNILTH